MAGTPSGPQPATQNSSPFVIGNLITDPEKFFGRTEEVQQIRDRLSKHESTSIVGPRRIGKSSTAYHIYSLGAAQLADTYDFVWVDGQSNHTSTVSHFCSRVAAALALSYCCGSTPADSLLHFENAILAHSKRAVIVINELEGLTTPNRRHEFDTQFFNTLRYLAEQGRCVLITTSYTPLKVVCSEVLGVSSPFYNIFEQITLGDFTPDEADSFLSLPHNGLLLTPLEITFIKTNIKDYRHPLVLQISADSVFHNRKRQDAQDALVRGIHSRVSNYLTHGDVKKGRLMKQRDITNKNTITKPIDIAISILIPVCGLAILMLEYGLLMQWLTNFQAVLLALVTAIIGFGVLVFAGRSIDIISESTFFKLFTSLIRKLPLLSSLAGMLGRHSGEQEP